MKTFYTLKEFAKIRSSIPSPVSYVSGCFDILHEGHIKLLERARKLSKHAVVVGTEDDGRVKFLKGEERPVNTFDKRVKLLNALKNVDFCIKLTGLQFSENYYKELYRTVIPNFQVIVKDHPYLSYIQKNARIFGFIIVTIKKVPRSSTSKILEEI